MAEAKDNGKITRVMVCVDNSENAEHALDYYTSHVHKPENEVLIFHVSDQVKMPTYGLFSEGVGFSPDEMKARVDELRHKNKLLEDKYNTKCNSANAKHKVLMVSEDHHGQGHAIVDAAKKHDINLIVIGSRGQGQLRRTILGSISDYVIHHTHIPTLVCPGHKHHHHHHEHHH